MRRSGGDPYYVQLFGWAGPPKARSLSPSRTPMLGWPWQEPNWSASTKRLVSGPIADYLAAGHPGRLVGAGVEEETPLGKAGEAPGAPAMRKHGLLEVPEVPKRAKVCFVDGEMADWLAPRRPLLSRSSRAGSGSVSAQTQRPSVWQFGRESCWPPRAPSISAI